MGMWQYFCFHFHLGLYRMQKPSSLSKIAPSINMVSNGIGPNNNLGIQRYFHLTYPPNINIWWVLQIWYPWVGSLIQDCSIPIRIILKTFAYLTHLCGAIGCRCMKMEWRIVWWHSRKLYQAMKHMAQVGNAIAIFLEHWSWLVHL